MHCESDVAALLHKNHSHLYTFLFSLSLTRLFTQAHSSVGAISTFRCSSRSLFFDLCSTLLKIKPATRVPLDDFYLVSSQSKSLFGAWKPCRILNYFKIFYFPLHSDAFFEIPHYMRKTNKNNSNAN